MLVSQLFDAVLKKPPVLDGADTLYVVTGYASPTMATYHLEQIGAEIAASLSLKVIVGMCKQDGLLRSHHEGFVALAEKNKKLEFSYLVHNSAVHTKVFAWFKRNLPITAYMGSANYTQSAFSGRQREAMIQCDPHVARDYFNEILEDCIGCTDSNVAEYVNLHEHSNFIRVPTLGRRLRHASPQVEPGLPHVRISLLDRNGQLPGRSGLNWGQRKGRDPNQAYIRLPADIYHADFFPPVGVPFTLQTDDGKSLICARAQQNGKAIHTPMSNSLLGEYFRNRLDLANGSFVTLDDLKRYGRTDIEVFQLDSETYHMDFSSPRDG